MTQRPNGWVGRIALVVAICSLGLSGFLAWQLQVARAQIEPIRPLIEGLVGDSGQISTEIRIPAGVPLEFDFPIDERVMVQVDTIIPLNTRITIPIRSALGDYDVPVPVRANIPVRANVPVRIRHNFQFRSTTPSDVTVPIQIGDPVN